MADSDATDRPDHETGQGSHPVIPEPQSAAAASPGFRIGNVLKVVVPLVLVGVGVIVFVGFFDGAGWLANQLNPPLVQAKGQIIYQGKPLEGAQINTRHANGKVQGSIGWTDAEGKFTLRTDINGYVEGAYAGEHQVVVTARTSSNTPSAPPLLTPVVYASQSTTPLRIVVTTAADKNDFTLTLEGEPPASGGGGGGPGGGGFDPEAIIKNVFDEFDKDQDDQLSAEEMQAIEGQRRDRLGRADANEDGVLERQELEAALTAPRPPAE